MPGAAEFPASGRAAMVVRLMSLLSQLRPTANVLSAPGGRFRTIVQSRLGKLGFGDEAFLLIMAVIIGAITGAAAVGFHQLTHLIRDLLYVERGEDRLLYGHRGMWLLVLLPAGGGLAVGLVSRYVFRAREGHGVVDVMESVIRTSGFQRPAIAIEKTLTSALTIGSGGSAGAEGPIVQIGAAIASGVGQSFRVARSQMPVLTGCGTAAGISAIFNAPFGGVLFTLEVILQDFSIRSFTPVVLASVIAQVTTQGTFQLSATTPTSTGPSFRCPRWSASTTRSADLGAGRQLRAAGPDLRRDRGGVHPADELGRARVRPPEGAEVRPPGRRRRRPGASPAWRT